MKKKVKVKAGRKATKKLTTKDETVKKPRKPRTPKVKKTLNENVFGSPTTGELNSVAQPSDDKITTVYTSTEYQEPEVMPQPTEQSKNLYANLEPKILEALKILEETKPEKKSEVYVFEPKWYQYFYQALMMACMFCFVRPYQAVAGLLDKVKSFIFPPPMTVQDLLELDEQLSKIEQKLLKTRSKIHTTMGKTLFADDKEVMLERTCSQHRPRIFSAASKQE